MAKPPTGNKVQILTDAEMDRKFEELGMSALLKECSSERCDRDPDVTSKPPYSSVVHKREYGIRFTKDDVFVALIFVWPNPDGEERRSIRQFLAPDGVLYRRAIAPLEV